MEACEKLSEASAKRMLVTIRRINRFIIIEIANSCMEEPVISKGIFMSSKTDRRRRRPAGSEQRCWCFRMVSVWERSGGGCVEADILRRALLMIRNEETKPQICHIDMTGIDAEDE